MKIVLNRIFITLIAAALFVPFPGSPAGSQDIPPAALAKAKSTADGLMKDLIGLLFSTLDAEGPAGAVRICADVAQERTAQHARDGIYVRRVSQKVRNPANRPDGVELQKLEQLQALHREKKLPAEVAEVRANPDGSRQLHYLRPIVLMERCLACHGPRDQIQPAVRELLARRYPDDRAVDYRAGDFRGAVSVRVPLDR
jgi:hypothetical protein